MLNIRNLRPLPPTRRDDPVIERKQKPKKLKPSKYKETRQFMARNIPNTKPKYADRSERERDKLKANSIAHSLRATKGATAKDRRIRRRRRKEYLRIKYKLQNRMKVCTICKNNKALSDFDYLRDKKHSRKYRMTYCTECRKDINARNYQKRKEAR